MKKKYFNEKTETKNKNLISFSGHLNKQYGKPRIKKREAYEQEFEAFKPGVLIKGMRQRQNLIRK